MTDPAKTAKTPPSDAGGVCDDPQVSGDLERRQRRSISMHEDVPEWHDCCSCEAEPYWEEAMAAQPPAPGSERDDGDSSDRS